MLAAMLLAMALVLVLAAVLLTMGLVLAAVLLAMALMLVLTRVVLVAGSHNPGRILVISPLVWIDRGLALLALPSALRPPPTALWRCVRAAWGRWSWQAAGSPCGAVA